MHTFMYDIIFIYVSPTETASADFVGSHSMSKGGALKPASIGSSDCAPLVPPTASPLDPRGSDISQSSPQISKCYTFLYKSILGSFGCLATVFQK